MTNTARKPRSAAKSKSAANTTSAAKPTSPVKQRKLERPHAHFAEPKKVLADGSLSKKEKADVLDSLEQDARLLATASDEGMSGGEATNLHEVLKAKKELGTNPAAKPAKNDA